eukprot:TRINITY_DN2144_c0_g1_i1.p1 TRINITY_DN2144_c0_g1~~TRINITY_DN2144_c0_g1_i1.p1  ORF type:complete len:610 (+),score=99.35 TRINITY_DN2144_c0_g1_i1:22-1851(+)
MKAVQFLYFIGGPGEGVISEKKAKEKGKMAGIEREIILGVYLSMAGGVPSFAFSAFSDTIKDKQGYSPTEINTIGSFMQAGVWTSILGGIMLDKYGPKVTAAASLMLGCTGYVSMYILTTISSQSGWYWYALSAYLSGQGGAYCYLIALKVCQGQAPASLRGRVVGVLATFVSLSAGIFTLLGQAFFKGAWFFLLLLIAHVCQCSIGFFLRTDIEESEVHREAIKKTTARLYIGAFTACVIILISSFVSGGPSDTIFGILAACILSFPLSLLVFTEISARRRLAADDDVAKLVSPTTPAGTATVKFTSPGPISKRMAYLEMGWLFISYLFAFGPAAASLNILGALVVSRLDLIEGATYTKSGPGSTGVPGFNQVTNMVTMFAVTNTLGRILTGQLTDYTREKLRKSFWFIVFGLVISSALFGLSFAYSSWSQLVFVALLGIGVGGVQTTIPQLAAEIFGMKKFASVLATMAFAPSSGSIAFSNINAKFEEHFSKKSFVWIGDKPTSEPVKYCFGNDCLHMALIVGSITSCTGALLAIVLWRQWLNRCDKKDNYTLIQDAEYIDDDDSDQGSEGSPTATATFSVQESPRQSLETEHRDDFVDESSLHLCE